MNLRLIGAAVWAVLPSATPALGGDRPGPALPSANKKTSRAGLSNIQAMLVVGNDGVFMTKDAGGAWRRVAGLKPKEGNYTFSPNWFGCYAWDPLNHILYASAMGNPVYRIQL